MRSSRGQIVVGPRTLQSLPIIVAAAQHGFVLRMEKASLSGFTQSWKMSLRIHHYPDTLVVQAIMWSSGNGTIRYLLDWGDRFYFSIISLDSNISESHQANKIVYIFRYQGDEAENTLFYLPREHWRFLSCHRNISFSFCVYSSANAFG